MRPTPNPQAARVPARRNMAALVVVLSTSLSALPACAHESQHAAQEATSSARHDGFEPRPRKPGDLVAVAVRTPPAPLPAGPATVRLALTGSPGVSAVEVRYGTEGALRVDAATPATVPLDAQRRAVLEVPVTVLGPGVHYLNVYLRANGRNSAFSVRLDAGENATVRQKRTLPEEGGFIVLPAQETRSVGPAR